MKKEFVALCIGDAVGEPGYLMLAKYLPQLKKRYHVDFVMVNGENSAKNGRGITPDLMKFFRECGVHVVTSGNHVWAKSAIVPYLDQQTDLLRPINYPSDCPGRGVTAVAVEDVGIVGVVNVQGRVFLKEHLDCPFRATQSVLTFLKSQTNIIIIDFHAEATAEKQALAYFLDGKVSAVLCTHTHVQTADERILPGQTAYISDIGMVGAREAIIGFKSEIALRGMLTQMPIRFDVEYTGPFIFNAVVVTIDTESGRAQSIERLAIFDNDLKLVK
jgi:metallophosphoesterase (TIGR00282 family)